MPRCSHIGRPASAVACWSAYAPSVSPCRAWANGSHQQMAVSSCVTSGSELLTADMARRGKAAFGVAAFDFYSASEG